MFTIKNLAKITKVPFVLPTVEMFPDGDVVITFFEDGKYRTEGLMGIEIRCTAKTKGANHLMSEYNYFNAKQFIEMYNWHYPILQPVMNTQNILLIGYFEYKKEE